MFFSPGVAEVCASKGRQEIVGERGVMNSLMNASQHYFAVLHSHLHQCSAPRARRGEQTSTLPCCRVWREQHLEVFEWDEWDFLLASLPAAVGGVFYPSCFCLLTGSLLSAVVVPGMLSQWLRKALPDNSR